MTTINGTDFATLFVAGGQVAPITNCWRHYSRLMGSDLVKQIDEAQRGSAPTWAVSKVDRHPVDVCRCLQMCSKIAAADDSSAVPTICSASSRAAMCPPPT